MVTPVTVNTDYGNAEQMLSLNDLQMQKSLQSYFKRFVFAMNLPGNKKFFKTFCSYCYSHLVKLRFHADS